jgi:hypothetical protein
MELLGLILQLIMAKTDHSPSELARKGPLWIRMLTEAELVERFQIISMLY